MEVEAPSDIKTFKQMPNLSPYKDKVEASLKRGEREKQLELLLQKTKKDKDKAIKLIVQIVGKVIVLISCLRSYIWFIRILFFPFCLGSNFFFLSSSRRGSGYSRSSVGSFWSRRRNE
jgi:hypothetical protein